ncbi:hypothetical protein LCGC14_1297860 [marine sediment metagenome]|uniref:Uncharacterized protein n=1 Tax=marine sediment metagenome TaxID=412755 RepID=A0A0F9NTD4_9ZZZZ
MAHDEYTETFEQILKDTLPQTPGIVRSVAMRELRLAAREFFEKSLAWTKIIDNVDATAGETDIVIDDGDDNTEVIAVLSIALTAGGKYLAPVAQRPPKFEESDDPNAFFVTSNPDHIRLWPYMVNTITDFMDVTVALIPAFAATALPRQITLKYYDALVDGYLARVYKHPNKPYSAPALAGDHRMIFKRAIGYYMAQRKQGFNNAQNWAYPRGWQVRRLGGNG